MNLFKVERRLRDERVLTNTNLNWEEASVLFNRLARLNEQYGIQVIRIFDSNGKVMKEWMSLDEYLKAG